MVDEIASARQAYYDRFGADADMTSDSDWTFVHDDDHVVVVLWDSDDEIRAAWEIAPGDSLTWLEPEHWTELEIHHLQALLWVNIRAVDEGRRSARAANAVTRMLGQRLDVLNARLMAEPEDRGHDER